MSGGINIAATNGNGTARAASPIDEIADQLPNLDTAGLSALLAELKGLEGRVLAQLLTANTTSPSKTTEDRLLTIERTAERLAVTPDFLYRHGRRLGLVVKLGDGTLRFSSAAIDDLIAQSRVGVVPQRRKRKAASP